MSFHQGPAIQTKEQWLGKSLSHLPTPSVVIDRAIYIQNCKRMLQAARNNGMSFRIHIKTHKTSEGTRLQLDPYQNEAGGEDGIEKSNRRLIISTVEEGWMLVNSGTIEDYQVSSVLYSMPPSPNTLQRLASLRTALQERKCDLLLMVDHPAQAKAVESLPRGDTSEWSVFIKVDAGYHRAGVPLHTQQFEETVKAVLEYSATSLYGFYVHAGNSVSGTTMSLSEDGQLMPSNSQYSATSQTEASSYLDGEIQAVSEASKLAREIIAGDTKLRGRYSERSFVLSVGATPTANAALIQSEDGKLVHGLPNDHDELELHAGNYAIYDLQQLATSMISEVQIALFVLSSVCSVYPGRSSDVGEALCDAGGLAMSKDRGPIPGFGKVRSDEQQGLDGWYLGRVSQEHGILTYSTPKEFSSASVRLPEYGEQLRILPQHACMTLANHPWFYIVDSSLETGKNWQDWVVRDIWTPAKFW
ncbi:hypothetical protein QFC22_000923 [Naganishia vaughanmartiniae]|uniref:Uncharacterized protein n=1 Tax=Naganishia vaughanmartiniae TaxID=1424756 RepID=A0ACC2XN39_9TREE|nr:hypothetical protein QFC22_000923 [Naganishia vaughanmartiniae]